MESMIPFNGLAFQNTFMAHSQLKIKLRNTVSVHHVALLCPFYYPTDDENVNIIN